MIGCDAVRFAVMALFAIGYAFHVLTLPMIYGGLVIISICAAGFLGRTVVEHSVSARTRRSATKGDRRS